MVVIFIVIVKWFDVFENFNLSTISPRILCLEKLIRTGTTPEKS
jgi:hypothetical protein